MKSYLIKDTTKQERMLLFNQSNKDNRNKAKKRKRFFEGKNVMKENV